MEYPSQTEKPLTLPFLATRETGEVFEYVLLKIDPQFALISLPSWVVDRTRLMNSEIISLHLEKPIGSCSAGNLIKGEVVSLASPESLYRIQFNKPVEISLSHEIISELELSKVTSLLIKDSLLLKTAISIYLKHLIPFFSRLQMMTGTQYEALKEIMLKEVQKHVQQKIDKLENLYKEQKEKNVELSLWFNLGDFRQMIESEIDYSLFILAFNTERESIVQVSSSSIFYSVRSYRAYLKAIKQLECRLYANYNRIVQLFIRSFELKQQTSFSEY